MCLPSILISPSEIGLEYHKKITVTYQLFGKPLGSAPVVLVNHALTGNSLITGTSGWWNRLIGDYLTINTQKYTVLAFDIPGNGFDKRKENLIEDYKTFSTKIIAKLFWEALKELNISRLFTVIGGSLGGAIAWEMAFLKPNAIELLLPVACNYKASDWLIGNVRVQDVILNNSSNPVEDARMHAMLLYRTPESFHQKFKGEYDNSSGVYKVESWLDYHGNALKQRYELASYKLTNHLLKTIGNDICEEDLICFLKKTTTKIHIISVDSDYMFTEKEQHNTYHFIKERYQDVHYSVIRSVHGHDAFLIEYEQLNNILYHHFKI